MKSTAISSQGTNRVTESKSESEPSDKEPVQQLEDCSDENQIQDHPNHQRKKLMSRVSDRDVTTQDSMMKGQGGLATEAN